jgi:CHAT domain-containing protein
MSLQFIRFVMVGIAGIVLTACQNSRQPTLSLDDARKVALNLEDQEMTAPPRSIDGLVDTLDVQQIFKNNPNSCVSKRDEMTTGELDHLSTYYQTQKNKTYGNWEWKFRHAAHESLKSGSLTNAIKKMEYAVRDSIYDGDRAGGQVLLGSYFARTGDFVNAQKFYSMGRFGTQDAANKMSMQSCRFRNLYWLGLADARISLAKGDMAGAEQKFLDAERDRNQLASASDKVCREQRKGWYKADLLLGRAEAILWQGRLVEAEVIAREVYRRARQMRPQALIILSRIFLELDRSQDALKTALGAIKLLDNSCHPSNGFQRARANAAVIHALVALENWQQSGHFFERVKAELTSSPELWENLFANSREYGLTLLHNGSTPQAIFVLQAAYAKAKDIQGEASYQAQEARSYLASSFVRQGRNDEARSILRKSIPALVDAWRQSSGESTNMVGRGRRLKELAEVYMTLLLDPNSGGDPVNPSHLAESFLIANSVGAKSVQKALTEGTARQLAKTPEAESLIREQQDLERQLTALRYRLNDMSVVSGRDSYKIRDKLKGVVRSAEAALRTLGDRIVREMPEYTALINPSALSVIDTQALLEPNEALIMTFVGRDRTFLWAFGKTGTGAVSIIPYGQTNIQADVSHLRKALNPPHIESVGDLPPYDIAAAYKLYERLLKPTRASWMGADSLIVVADGPLGQFPFALMVTEPVALPKETELLFANYRTVPWLARSHALTVLPSVTALKSLRSRRSIEMATRPFVGFADPFFSLSQQIEAKKQQANAGSVQMASRGFRLRNAPQTRAVNSAEIERLPRLPDTRNEILAIARSLNADAGRDIFLGERANETQVKNMNLKTYQVVSFATHGLVPGDLNGLVEPALALSSSKVTGQKEDGLLTAGEIMGLRLNADFVVLSACNTAAAEGRGAESVSGLGRAFFYAGARSLLASNWPVHSGATTELMSRLFKFYANGTADSRSDALKLAIANLIDGQSFRTQDGIPVFSYAHPIFWGPFSLIGDGTQTVPNG